MTQLPTDQYAPHRGLAPAPPFRGFTAHDDVLGKWGVHSIASLSSVSRLAAGASPMTMSDLYGGASVAAVTASSPLTKLAWPVTPPVAITDTVRAATALSRDLERHHQITGLDAFDTLRRGRDAAESLRRQLESTVAIRGITAAREFAAGIRGISDTAATVRRLAESYSTISTAFAELDAHRFTPAALQASSSGQVGVSVTAGGGPGVVGGAIDGGAGVEVSNATRIQQLDHTFIQGGVQAVDGVGVAASGFRSLPGDCQAIYGGTIGPVLGGGLGAYGGASYTVTHSVSVVGIAARFLGGLARGLEFGGDWF